MGNQTDNNQNTIAGCGKNIRMAYSLNNTQPVLCTLISDQPFFYMDEEIIEEEEAILSDGFAVGPADDMAEFFLNDEPVGAYDDGMDVDTRIGADGMAGAPMDPALEKELCALRHKMESYDRLALDFAQPRDLCLQQFITDSAAIGKKADKTGKEANQEKVINALRALLGQSRMAASLLACADHYGVEFVMSYQVDTVSYDKKAGKILIRPDMDALDQTLMCVQELRRHWQHRQGALVHPLSFHPDQAVLINRAQLADLMVAVIHSAWELKLKGYKEYWMRVENSALCDLGRAFAREAHSDFRTLNNGKAAAAVFETWFLSERCQQQDKKLIQAMLADYHGYVFDNPEASRMISVDLICSLGHQPFGKNYLAPYAQLILNDPVFTEVRDRANANFLWFIKFERSFNEAEQQMEQGLQSSDVIHTSGIDQVKNNNIFEDNHNAQPITPAGAPFHDGSGQFNKCGNIIHVAFGNRSNAEERTHS